MTTFPIMRGMSRGYIAPFDCSECPGPRYNIDGSSSSFLLLSSSPPLRPFVPAVTPPPTQWTNGRRKERHSDYRNGGEQIEFPALYCPLERGYKTMVGGGDGAKNGQEQFHRRINPLLYYIGDLSITHRHWHLLPCLLLPCSPLRLT